MDFMLERLKAMKKRLEDIDRILTAGEGDFKSLAQLSKERASLETPVAMFDKITAMEGQLSDAREMMKDPDPEMREMAKEEANGLEKEIEETRAKLQVELLPKDENDEKNVIMEIRGAAGGDEANIFAGDLFRMYEHYADKKGWKIKVLDSQPTALGGYSLVSFMVVGKGAYSRLKFESGAHRVQRVPVTEANGRIQTSTATVLVMPEIQKVDIAINPADLEIDTYHSSGNVNKTESAVRITHKPTGIVVSCQVERSQMQNKEMAMEMLKAKLQSKYESEQEEKIGSERRLKVGTGERNERIRTYNYPQNRVTDHRIGYTMLNLPRFMDGDMDDLLDALREADQTDKLQEETRKLEEQGK